eukprot:5399221-Pleurochrysis_carterae.AAC.2
MGDLLPSMNCYLGVLKADSDSYILLPNLIRDVALLRSSDDGCLAAHCLLLQSKFNRSAYKKEFDSFADDGASPYPQWMMCGMMYGLSADLMRWLASPESLLARWSMHGHVRRYALAAERYPFAVDPLLSAQCPTRGGHPAALFSTSQAPRQQRLFHRLVTLQPLSCLSKALSMQTADTTRPCWCTSSSRRRSVKSYTIASTKLMAGYGSES